MPTSRTDTIQINIAKELALDNIRTRHDLDCFKRKIAKEYGLTCLKNSELLKIYLENVKKNKGQSKENLLNILRKRPVRSLSGIVNVSVLTKSYPCPGQCIFCPNEKNVPKSYLKNEPAVQRAILNRFRPYQQVRMRLKALRETGHPIDKVDLRVIGGTWSYYPKKYQQWFIQECFRACNEATHNEAPNKSRNEVCNDFQMCNFYATAQKLHILWNEQKKNEKAKCRIVGISVETRPDYINAKEIKWMRELGITKVELGAQSIYDDVLKINRRGHNVAATIRATQLLKNSGFKVSYQMMPGLLGSNFKKDVAMFRELFSNPDFQPDYLKIYPLALVKNTKIYNIYKQGKYKPYPEKELLQLLVEIKKIIPRWCRVERIIRDIPSQDIVEGGASTLNLREMALSELKKQGMACQCIRCREAKDHPLLKMRNGGPMGLRLFKERYPASGGEEIFLSFEDKERAKLFALLRLRLPQCSRYSEVQPPSIEDNEIMKVLKGAAIIREVHTYGQMAEIHRKAATTSRAMHLAQHKGLGKKLIEEAEKIARQAGYKKMAVISAIGVRPYYRKLGYKLQDTYMIKHLNEAGSR